MAKKNVKTQFNNVLVHIVYNERKHEKISVTGYAVDENGYRVDGEPKITRTAETKSMIEDTVNKVFALVVSNYREKRTIKRDLDLIARNSNEGLDPSTEAVQAFYEVEEDGKNGIYVHTWAESTFKSYMSYFRINILKKLQYYENSEDFSEIELEDLLNDIKESVKNNVRDTENEANAAANAKKYLNAADKIYKAMRLKRPTLPSLNMAIDDNFNIITHQQQKSIPLDVYLQFHKLVEELAVKEPLLARAIVLMDSGGLRAGEAAAFYQGLQEDNGEYITVYVLKQEYEGTRIDRLKKPASYRHIILDEWGTMMLRRINKDIGDKDEKIAPIEDSKVSSKVKELLLKCNLDQDFILDAYADMKERPSFDKDGHIRNDVSAHILRRNRASIWRNYCGYTSEELDYYLGHKIYVSRFEYNDQNAIKTKNLMAKKNYRFELYPEISNSPKYRPIDISAGEEVDIIPYSKYVVRNNSDEPLYLYVQLKAVEPGEPIIIKTEKDMEITLSRMSQKFDGKRQKDTVIGTVEINATEDNPLDENEEAE